jgi:hypothetical protein
MIHFFHMHVRVLDQFLDNYATKIVKRRGADLGIKFLGQVVSEVYMAS